MKVLGAVALLFLAALAITPTASAQGGDPNGVTLVCPDLAAPIPYAGQAGLACDVSVGCLEFQNTVGSVPPEFHVFVEVVSPPAWLTSAPVDVDFAPQDCITGQGRVSKSTVVPLAVTQDAPGVVEQTLNLVAAVGSTESPPDTAVVTVAYHVNYTLVPDVTFPLAVNGTQASFNVTVTQASNARSMVMMEQLRTSTGTLAGPASEVYENDAGKPVSKTFRFTFKAPETEWTNATATFTAFGHYLLADGRAGEFNTPGCTALGFPTCDATGTPMAFTFTNAAEHEHDDEKESPSPVAPLLVLGLVALAALVRRQR